MIVITGIHHSFHAIEANRWPMLPLVWTSSAIWAMANIAQGGACLRGVRTRDEQIKSVAIPSGSPVAGYYRGGSVWYQSSLWQAVPGSAVGGAIGGFYVAFMDVGMSAVGLTGLPGAAIALPADLINYILGMVIAFAGAFVILGDYAQGRYRG